MKENYSKASGNSYQGKTISVHNNYGNGKSNIIYIKSFSYFNN